MDAGRRRRIGKRCLKALAATAAGLLLAEAVLQFTPLGDRIYYYAPIYVGEREARPSRAFIADPILGWRMRPNSTVQFPTEGREVEYLANSEGFRTGPDREVSDRPKRIAFLGDSFAWGFGVQWHETSAAHLEHEFEQCAVNLLALPGFGLDQIAEAVRHRAIPQKPALAIIAIFSEDLSRTFTAHREIEGFNKPLYHLAGGELIQSTEQDRPGEMRCFLERHSKLYAAYWATNRVLGKRHGIGSWWDLNLAFIKRIQADLKAAEIPALFVYIPKRTGPPLPALAQHMRDTGAHWIDLSELERAELDSWYFKTDGHFSPAGHRKLSKRITKWIEAHQPQLR